MSELPSKTTKKKYLQMPSHDVVESDDEYSRCGKWILTNRTGNVSWIDRVWIDLQELLQEGCIIMIKASTAAMRDTNGIVMCMTRPGIENIKRAAEAIRGRVHYESCMYYKVNTETENKIDHRFNYTRIGKYMHTFKGFFYVRNSLTHWTLVDGAETNHRRSSSPSLLLDKELQCSDWDQLPSRTTSLSAKYDSLEDYIIQADRNIHMLVSLQDDSSAADRMTIVGKRLLDEGLVRGITWLKISSSEFVFRFYTLNRSDLKSVVKLCDDIMRRANYFTFMYFWGRKGFGYRYSPEKELYLDEEYLPLPE